MSSGAIVSEGANARQATQSKALPSNTPDSDTPAHSPVLSVVANEFVKLTALILEKSKTHDKNFQAILVTIRATDRKLAKIANGISQVKSHLYFLEKVMNYFAGDLATQRQGDDLHCISPCRVR